LDSELITHRWGSEIIVVHEESITPAQLPCFIAEINKENVGLITTSGLLNRTSARLLPSDSLQATAWDRFQLSFAQVKMVAKQHGFASRLCLSLPMTILLPCAFISNLGSPS